MMHAPTSIEKPLALFGFHPFRAFLKRLGDCCGDTRSATSERYPFEPEFHALDDVACAPIRRR